MIDDLIYAAITDESLSGLIGDADSGWRVYPRSSLGFNGIPASPMRPYVQ